MKSAVEIVDSQIEKYIARDAKGFSDCYELDAVCRYLPSGRIIANGRDEIEQVWSKVFARGHISFTLENRITLDRFVVDQEYVEFGDMAPQRAIAIYLVGADRIRAVWFLNDVGEGASE